MKGFVVLAVVGAHRPMHWYGVVPPMLKEPGPGSLVAPHFWLDQIMGMHVIGQRHALLGEASRCGADTPKCGQ